MPATKLNMTGEITITKSAFDLSVVRVFIDQSDVGFFRSFEHEKTFTVNEGTHSVQVRILNEVSDILITEIAAGLKLKYKLGRKKIRPSFKMSDFWCCFGSLLDQLFLDSFFYNRSLAKFLAEPLADVFTLELKRVE